MNAFLHSSLLKALKLIYFEPHSTVQCCGVKAVGWEGRLVQIPLLVAGASCNKRMVAAEPYSSRRSQFRCGSPHAPMTGAYADLES